MKIAFISTSHKVISVQSAGGLEVFTRYLLNTLVRLGHEVTFFTARESDSSIFPGVDFKPCYAIADLEKTEGENLESKSFTINYTVLQFASLAKVITQSAGYDVIHCSSAQWYVPFLLAQTNNSIPIVSTVHVNNLRPKMQDFILNNFPNAWIANISEFTAQPFLTYNKRRTVLNGIDFAEFEFNEKPNEYVAWIGRIAPVKGLKEAIVAAKKAGVKLKACGPIDFVDYFNTEVKPLLDDTIEILPPLFGDEKAKFLSQAKAVLMPVQWDEPFGLVAAESLASGTPVIAFKRGGLPEIIKNGETGFLVDTVDEMAEKISLLDRIDRTFCKNDAEKNFSAERMAKEYVDYYSHIIASSK